MQTWLLLDKSILIPPQGQMADTETSANIFFVMSTITASKRVFFSCKNYSDLETACSTFKFHEFCKLSTGAEICFSGNRCFLADAGVFWQKPQFGGFVFGGKISATTGDARNPTLNPCLHSWKKTEFSNLLLSFVFPSCSFNLAYHSSSSFFPWAIHSSCSLRSFSSISSSNAAFSSLHFL